ncbi:MAG: hypothetical protein K9N09_09580 [Candidatus Cloacimonetes bacterium]|nr:hypothetical protein [Candidatus Cloacimonadota bacterium]MCF7814279.1 hypothetical protein [Candidatus Cloacimonadota bacterium]MCF7868940.1 hypothetical protein [Candidatus Cloacimonadota bacterium]MCF7884320.1 hypothetical protein [Candidatus Cloacimonadota bacterium]
MISLDWKERLVRDTEDFIERKLPAGDYDIDIIYNAYPQRIDNNIPHAVITLVGKTFGSKLNKKYDKYMPFYDYLTHEKGENGRMIFAYIMARAVKKKPDLFIPYIEKFLITTEDQKSCNLVIDKTIFPLMKKFPMRYLDLVVNWIKKDNEILTLSLQKMLIKLMKYNPDVIEPLISKLETSWLYASPNMIKLNYHLIKAIYKIDPDFYLKIYQNYKNTRNPVFAEILCNALCCYNDTLQEICDNWARSGNVKLKKIGLHGQKIIKKKKPKNKKK